MIIEFVSKNYNPSDKLREIVEKKIAKLDKFFDDDTRIKALFKQIKENNFTLELTIPIESGVLRAEVSSDNMYNNIDIALPKLEKQIIRHHEKIASKTKKFRRNAEFDTTKAESKPTEKQGTVVKSKSYKLLPMTVEDALEELELVGHDFFVFFNKETNCINVLYRRNDENYGIIETTV